MVQRYATLTCLDNPNDWLMNWPVYCELLLIDLVWWYPNNYWWLLAARPFWTATDKLATSSGRPLSVSFWNNEICCFSKRIQKNSTNVYPVQHKCVKFSISTSVKIKRNKQTTGPWPNKKPGTYLKKIARNSANLSTILCNNCHKTIQDNQAKRNSFIFKYKERTSRTNYRGEVEIPGNDS